MREKCNVCDGSGDIEKAKCRFCGGKGYYQVKAEESEIYEDPPCGEIIEF